MLTVDIINKLDSDKEKLINTLFYAMDFIEDINVKEYILEVIERINN